MAAIWSSSSRCHVPEENRQDIQGATKCVWHCRWFFNVGYDNNGADLDKILFRVLQISKKEKPVQNLTNSNVSLIFWWDYFHTRHEIKSEKGKGT